MMTIKPVLDTKGNIAVGLILSPGDVFVTDDGVPGSGIALNYRQAVEAAHLLLSSAISIEQAKPKES